MNSRLAARLGAFALILSTSACTSGGGSAAGIAPTVSPPSASGPSASGSSARRAGAGPDRIVVVVLENRSQTQIIGNPDAPFINSVAKSGALFTNSFAVTHPSQPNYLALFSGSTQGVSSDACPKRLTGPNLASGLRAAGRTFVGYSEGLPSVGSQVCSAGAYARKHNPWVNFADVPAAVNQPFTAFPKDYSSLPTVSFVIPNLDNDMHDGTVRQSDQWLQSNLGAYATWAAANRSWLIVTFDEDDRSDSNRIPTIFAGAGIAAGTYPVRIDHYRVLRTIEDAYGVTPAGASADVAPITAMLR